MVTHTPSTAALIRRLVRGYVAKHRATILLAVIAMTIVAATTAANAWLLKPVLDDIFFNKNETMLYLIPGVIVGIAVLGGAANYTQTVLMRKVGQRVIADMQIDLFEHFICGDLVFFHEHGAGRLISRFTNDIQMMRNAVSSVLTGLAKELLAMVFLIAVMVYQSWELSLFAFFLFPAAIYPILRLGKRMRKITDSTQEQLSRFAGQLDETFQAAEIVKAYHREDYEIMRARTMVDGLYRLYLKASRVQALASPMVESLAAIAIAGIVFYGGHEVIEGETSPGAFFSFIGAMIMAYRPLRAVAGLNTQLQEGMAAARRFFAALDVKPMVVETPQAQTLQVTRGEVRFEHVSFRYDHAVAALEDVNLIVPAGKMAALVGPSGAGKSTLMRLLMRFYDVNDGRIALDGQDISQATFASLRGNMAFVSQNVLLFDETVMANIAYGREGATQEEVIAAAKAADAHDFILAMPDGYQTRIGPSGARLSGGQRQRISIARAMLRNAPILLLDEATSSLDTASEQSVHRALDELMAHRTTLVIAHRLSTVQHADIIYVLEKGRVAASGTHEELLQQGGLYQELYSMQFNV